MITARMGPVSRRELDGSLRSVGSWIRSLVDRVEPELNGPDLNLLDYANVVENLFLKVTLKLGGVDNTALKEDLITRLTDLDTGPGIDVLQQCAEQYLIDLVAPNAAQNINWKGVK